MMNILSPIKRLLSHWMTRTVASLLLLTVLAACGAQASSSAGSGTLANPTQTNEGGGVTIKATLLEQDSSIMVKVALDTHSVELDGYDLRQLATLRLDQGPLIQPSGWDAPAGGHHRQGTLTFPATTPDGQPVLLDDARTIEVIIRDIGGVPERVLQWTR